MCNKKHHSAYYNQDINKIKWIKKGGELTALTIFMELNVGEYILCP